MNTLHQELRRRGHSYRGFEPHEVMDLAEQDKAEARAFFDFLEGGRFDPMLDATQRMYRALDGDERETFWRRNPDLMRWVHVWAFAEEVGRPARHRPDDVELFPRR